MALRKSTLLGTGVAADYYRIDSLTVADGWLSVCVGLYVSESVAKSGHKPMATRTVTLTAERYTRQSVINSNLMADTYSNLKALAIGQDVMGTTVSPLGSFLTGEFTDA